VPVRRNAAVLDPGAAGLVRLLLDTRRSYRGGAQVIAARQRARLAAAVAHARAHSAFYWQRYAGLPDQVTDPGQLPVVGKVDLMAAFDDVVTDARITRTAVEAFVADPGRIGEDFLGDYTLATTSGTTGTRGLFVLDRGSLAVATAISARLFSTWLGPRDVARIVRGGGRLAMISATGGHFASAAAAARLRRTRRGARRVRQFAVATPLPALTAQLNDFAPAVLAPYATTAALLAGEQAAGRLHIRPALVALAAEGLPAAEQRRIATAFHAVVGNSYAATECPFLSFSCRDGWLHVNSDWAILEPVGADHRPTPPGEQSHTVLLTNLANRVQPILRYDLGDRVLARPDPCGCGSPLPAIRVAGRTADVLTFPSPGGGTVVLTPLTLSALLDQLPGVELAQLVQTTPTTLRLHLQPAAGTDPGDAWRAAEGVLRGLLHAHGLDAVSLERAPEPPRPSSGGKYRQVQPLPPQPAT
jgi:phenylacetate-coenzyme A ligase PaaK-like adenylate-forming protein